MKQYFCGEDSHQYGSHLKQRLRERYGNSIYIVEGKGQNDIVTMKEKTSHILRSYFMRDEDTEEESQKKAIIETAARLIKSDIKTEVPSVIDQYPGTDMLNLDSTLRYFPDTLHFMLDFLCVGKGKGQKVAGVGQAIIQALCPRAVLAPVPVSFKVHCR